jgi:hypothetical protein
MLPPRDCPAGLGARRQHRGRRAADALRTLTPALIAYLYAPPEQTAAQEPEIAQQIAQIRRQIVQELGVRRLTLQLLILGWQRLYGGQKV